MTNHYARANLETKRLALAKVDTSTRPSKPPRWKRDPDLLAWLNRRGTLGGGPRRSPGVVPAIGNASANRGDHGITTAPSTPNYAREAANLISQPCETRGLGLFHHPGGVTMPHRW